MRRPLIKVCGITNIDDAKICLKYGASMLGFIFYEKSPRFALPETVKEILAALKGRFSFQSVGVFVNPSDEYVNQIINISSIDILQFHGDESPSFIKNFNKKKIKAFRIKDKSDIQGSYVFKDVDYFLFDTYSRESYGGTGKVFDWNLLDDFLYKDRLILSGGMNSCNINDAISAVKPYAVDISSSLEKEPGIKDSQKVEEFFSMIEQSSED